MKKVKIKKIKTPTTAKEIQKEFLDSLKNTLKEKSPEFKEFKRVYGSVGLEWAIKEYEKLSNIFEEDLKLFEDSLSSPNISEL